MSKQAPPQQTKTFRGSRRYERLTPDEPLRAPPSFLAYTPVALAFGTSGLRGLVKDITDLEAYINVKAALRYMLASRDIAAGSTVVIAGDLRPSTDRILVATVQAVLDAGCLVEYAGKIDPPRCSVAPSAPDARRHGEREPHSLRP